MKHLKKVYYVIFASVILAISALNVTVFLKKAASADLSTSSIETIAQETNSGELGKVDYSKGYVNNNQPCNVSQVVHCEFGFTIPDWVPYVGGTSCTYSWDKVIQKAGTENYCTYTGGSSGCSFHPCRENGTM